MELKIDTDMGEITAVFLDLGGCVTAWVENLPGIVVQAEDLHSAIIELRTSIRALVDVQSIDDLLDFPCQP